MRLSIFDLRSSIFDPRSSRVRGIVFLVLCIALIVIAGCGQNMRDQSRLQPFEANAFFPDDQSARPLVDGTVAREQSRDDELLSTGKIGGQIADTFPLTVTQALLERGRLRFNIYCSPCHGAVGDGNGMIVQRGFTHPPSFHDDRLRQAPVGHFFDVITNGFGAMYSYADRVAPEDRWAIIAYIRALQLSQHATIDDVPPEQRGQLK
jgi:mono/diheme cytochrome c family protein